MRQACTLRDRPGRRRDLGQAALQATASAPQCGAIVADRDDPLIGQLAEITRQRPSLRALSATPRNRSSGTAIRRGTPHRGGAWPGDPHRAAVHHRHRGRAETVPRRSRGEDLDTARFLLPSAHQDRRRQDISDRRRLRPRCPGSDSAALADCTRSAAVVRPTRSRWMPPGSRISGSGHELKRNGSPAS